MAQVLMYRSLLLSAAALSAAESHSWIIWPRAGILSVQRMLNGIVPVFPARTMGSLPNMAVRGARRGGLGASKYSLQVSAFIIQSS